MATIQEISPAPWRLMLLPASFSGVPYHVEHQARSSGRRIVMHEYPKRNTPYAEDMGRHAIRYQVTGYLVGPSYNLTKLALITALENATGGILVDPYLVTPMMAASSADSAASTASSGGFDEAGFTGGFDVPADSGGVSGDGGGGGW
jgi:prophage DNA circulation protein